MSASDVLARIVAGDHLSRGEARELFVELMNGRVDPQRVAGLLAALATKGETIDEIVGAAEALRMHATRVALPAGVAAIDTCGTGGDGQPTFNVSTAVAIVAAAAGATVAKHGNRSNIRPSGSAEVLAALGVNVDADVPTLERCLERCRVAFLYAVRLHPAMRHVAPVRRALAMRTIFNLVGPLANPAGVRRQLLGVNRAELVEPMLAALRDLGAERALVVHGQEGLCDLSISGPTLVARWDGSAVRIEEVDACVAGVAPAPLEELFVDGPEQSATVIREILAGRGGPAREMVVLNASAALWVAGLAENWAAGAALARETLDSGRARSVLKEWCEVSHAIAMP